MLDTEKDRLIGLGFEGLHLTGFTVENWVSTWLECFQVLCRRVLGVAPVAQVYCNIRTHRLDILVYSIITYYSLRQDPSDLFIHPPSGF